MLNFLQEEELITETFFQADDIADTDHWPPHISKWVHGA
jgi:hypothetical protein